MQEVCLSFWLSKKGKTQPVVSKLEDSTTNNRIEDARLELLTELTIDSSERR